MRHFHLHMFITICILTLPIGSTTGHTKEPLKLQSYGPNTIGLTRDVNDVSFMDFKISITYPLFHDGNYKDNKWNKLNFLNPWMPMPYFSFTGRFGQYINSRNSSPVISKRFNPKLFGRYWLKDKNYIDIGYAHESNGQNIEQESTYINLRNEFINNNENPDFADDYISRGWDYWSFDWHYNNYKEISAIKSRQLSLYLNLKHFLKKGKLQEQSEEVNIWESRFNDKQRRHVDGITLLARYSTHYFDENKNRDFFSGQKFAVLFTTGYRDAFEHNTTRLEYTFKFYDIPLMLWWSNGYNSDLIDYNQRIRSFGMALELRSFLSDI